MSTDKHTRAPLVLDILFSRFRWWRKLVGGHWERWWIEGVMSEVWMRREHGGRPAGAYGSPVCEEWP